MIKSEDIKKVMDGLMNIADEERSKDPAYQKLFKEHDGIEGLLRKTEMRMTTAVLDACHVLEEKYKVKITDEVYKVLMGLPLFEDSLEKHITNLEGFVCCVDKTYYLISDFIKSKLNVPKEEK